MAGDELPVLLFATPAELEAWLEDNHSRSEGAWLKIAKKGVEPPSVTYAEALELALCFGWIDSQKRGHDERHFLQRFTPRRPRGRWSKINREKAEALLEAGALRPAGLAEVEAAKADGRWQAAYEGARAAKVPPTTCAASSTPTRAAREFFAGSTAPTATRSSTASRRRSDRRRGSGACASSSPMLERGEKIHG